MGEVCSHPQSPEASGRTKSVPWDSPYRKVWKGWPLPSPAAPRSGPHSGMFVCRSPGVSLLSMASSCPEALSRRGGGGGEGVGGVAHT